MINLIKSTFYKEALTKRKLIKFISSAKILSFSEECGKFEKRFSHWQERKDAVFVNSGSSANFALLQSLKNLGRLQSGDKIAFSSVTWSTNVMPIIQLGMVPVPVDVETETLNISSVKLLKVLRNHKIRALFVTNLLGFCGDIDEIAKICTENKILLIEDNCESLGTVYKGKKLGNFGLASTFSFYVGHHMSTIEGGAICTDDMELSQMLRLVRAHGWDRNLTDRQKSLIRKRFKIENDFFGKYSFYDLGYNFRPTEINGFIGNVQLDFVDEIIQKRKDNFYYLAQNLYCNKDYIPIRYDNIDFVSNFAFPIICRNGEVKRHLIKKCQGKIEIRPIVGGDMTEQPFFKKYSHVRKNHCPNASLIHNFGLYFGNNPELTRKELHTIINIFS